MKTRFATLSLFLVFAVLLFWWLHRPHSYDEWRTPINFFGRVIDENEAAVAGANVHFIWTDLSPKGNSERTATSDGNGLFSLRATNGKNLIVEVSKTGYYEYQPSGAAFNYAGENQNFVPDQGNPVVFRLKRKGVAEPLIHIQAAMGGARDFIIPKDGTPVEISLATGKSISSGQGDLMVQCWTDDQGKSSGQKYDWRCRVSVPNGGIMQTTNLFDFQAPTEGYQPSDEINMPITLGIAWADRGTRKYFLKLANGNYARMHLEMIAAGGHFFDIESFLNPSGSRNLEFDPTKEIKVDH